ncbi:hypothetical protein OIV83_001363 [Microbotryomycetes sp. JL201]|nr:hypothetical protein OIV83_001363 [Microbotryomycetes sp. JL201]
MFRSYQVDISSDVEKSTELELYIVFDSAFVRGRMLQEQYLGRGRQLACWNGDPTGPWRPIRIEAYDFKITNIHPFAKVAADLSADLILNVERTGVSSVHVSVVGPDDKVLRKVTIEAGCSSHTIRLNPEEFQLWWPSGMGAQPQYTARAFLTDHNGKVLHAVSKKFGFRRIRVVQEALGEEPGTSFCFHVNNVPVFAGGANWIPLDSFLTNATKTRYHDWLQLMVEGNMNMVRVWGGGIYESDDFYDLCDELGILVWQDFMFACGLYPAHDSFVENFRREAEDNVKRLSYQIAESEGAVSQNQGRCDKFPARRIYEKVLPEIVASLTDIYYHPGSPWGGTSSSDVTVGDNHQWNVWHGSQEPYQSWDKLAGRFVSEFGMLSLPDTKTIEGFLTHEKDRFPQSSVMAAHTKAAGFERRLALYLTENIRYDFDMAD